MDPFPTQGAHPYKRKVVGDKFLPNVEISQFTDSTYKNTKFFNLV